MNNTLFNEDWRFQRGDVRGAETCDCIDAWWRTLDLPHDFQIEQPWDEHAGANRGFKAHGVAWYRKHFATDPAWQGSRVFLDFEGLLLHGTVWCNGVKVLEIDYGYLGGEADVTDLLVPGGMNVVAVRADAGGSGDSRWYTGAGLFRDVWLRVRNPVSIARHGVFVTTPRVTEAVAEVCVQVEIAGLCNRHDDVEIRAAFFNPEGIPVAQIARPAPQGDRRKSMEVALPSARIASPRLWSCEMPHLYSLEVCLVRDGEVLDRATANFGIRTVEFSTAFGLKLNGRKVVLKGAANHHDLGALGAAVHERAIERLFLRLREFGFNHIRCSHNPYSVSFLELADRHGILIVDELTDKWSDDAYWPGRKPFTEIWHRIVPEWIKRDRNHPSVILWSLGNELQMREDLCGFDTGDWGVTTYRILDLLVKRHDPSRNTTVAMFPARANAVFKNDPEFGTDVVPPELAQVTEVTSFNYLYKDYETYRRHAPHMIIYQSEAATSEMTGAFFGMDLERMVGLAYWGAVEYWGESTGWPRKGWTFSFFNHVLEPHPQAYLVRSAFADTPLVRLAVVDREPEGQEWNDVRVGHLPLSSHWNREPGDVLKVFAFTNAQEVELFLDDTSLGARRNPMEDPDRRNRVLWEHVPYGRGGVLTAVARTGGHEVARDCLETTGPAAALRLDLENDGDWQADGRDLCYATLRAVDARGRLVLTATGTVLFTVEGEATLRAVDNGDHATDSVFSGCEIPLHNGFALAILRATRIPGVVRIRAEVCGLTAAHRETTTMPEKNPHTHTLPLPHALSACPGN